MVTIILLLEVQKVRSGTRHGRSEITHIEEERGVYAALNISKLKRVHPQ